MSSYRHHEIGELKTGKWTVEFWFPNGRIEPFDFETREEAAAVYEALQAGI
jgi:hypothetical protein